jgi:ABC-type glycerol-3-phosphate transport system permease component
MKFLYFILFLTAGFSAVYFAYPLYKITGNFDWVEKYLGSGGTITFWRLIGIAMVLFSFFYLSNF